MEKQRHLIWLGVSGAPRSGTTILAYILNQHPEIGLFVEYGLERYIRAVGSIFDRADELDSYDQSVTASKRAKPKPVTSPQDAVASPQDAVASPQDAVASPQDAIDASEIESPPTGNAEDRAETFYQSRRTVSNAGPFRPSRHQHEDQMLVAGYRMVFPGRKLRVVGDKMPLFGVKNDVVWLRKRLPHFRLLHIVRNPLDVINSSLSRRNKMRRGEDNWHVQTIEEAASEWISEWNWLQMVRREMGDAILILKYEDVATNTEAALKKICKFLELSSPLSPSFEAIPDSLRLYALTDREKAKAISWFGPLSRSWEKRPLSVQLGVARRLPTILEPGNEIDFTQQGKSQQFIQYGFYDTEPTGTWTDGERAEIAANLGFNEEACRLTVTFRAISYCRQIRVLVNGVLISTIEIDESPWEERRIDIDFMHPVATVEGTVITLEIDRPKAPEDPPTSDSRAMGIFIKSISIARQA
ncbi:sulfotransferase [Nitrospirillum sp. BR 11164]|uniref:sulfotransferase family protein n=1 Tax=Nitrospirillum sp. BR 11164 TaxID=3104324 RepID=UPI002AFF2706|nr:sulfotransferase [Nitrospirillum sp. BR 11164]MEA1649032.1 sulfotransferase [Nitrospirillum sp. BR 11164]